MPHDHHHPYQPHPYQEDHAEPTSRSQSLGRALRELLIEGGFYSEDEERQVIEAFQNANPGNGAKMVARAWVDPGYKAFLLQQGNGNKAAEELGYEPGPVEFTVMENTDEVHNVIVCTLCSCYPRSILGMSPAWYKSKEYRSRVVREPRRVLAEFGTHLEDSVQVRVHDSTAELRYMVMPQRPAGTEGWSESALAALVTRDSMIGVQRELKLPDGND